MTRILRIGPPTLLVLALLSPSGIFASPNFVPGEVLVKFKPGVSTRSIDRFYSKSRLIKIDDLPLVKAQRVQIPNSFSVEEAVRMFQSDPDVLYAEPNFIRKALVLPNDPDLLGQIQLGSIHIPEAWDLQDPRTEIRVAIIDSGVDYSHSDLLANIWSNDSEGVGDLNGDGFPGVAGIDDDGDGLVDEDSQGRQPGDPEYSNDLWEDDDENGYIDDLRGWDFVGGQVCTVPNPGECLCPQDQPGGIDESGDNDATDDFGHGSHVAGILGARGDNGIGIAGILWEAEIIPLKIIDHNGCGSLVDEIQAIQYAIAQGAHLINASFGSPGFSEFERLAIEMAHAAGVVFVAASGNDGASNDHQPIFPASYDLPNLISVASFGGNGNLSTFSNFGKKSVLLAAPGELILSTVPKNGCPGANNLCNASGFNFSSGTSMAAPHVTGIAGLLLSQDPLIDPAQIKAIISLSAVSTGDLKGRVASGGRVDAESTLSREANSGLSGGGGGCGASNLAYQAHLTPFSGVGSLLPIVFPIGFQWVRRGCRRLSRRRIKFNKSVGRLIMSALLLVLFWNLQGRSAWADLSSGAKGNGSTHSMAIKVGLHQFLSSEYFDTNSSFIEPRDLTGLFTEVEYEPGRWDRSGVSFSLGHYDARSDTRTICCTEITFSTDYFLVTPKIKASVGKGLIGFLGGGLGAYRFQLKQRGPVSDSLTTMTLGFHVLFGMIKKVSPHMSASLEFRYASAGIKNANSLDDRLDVGGFTLGVGLAYFWRTSI